MFNVTENFFESSYRQWGEAFASKEPELFDSRVFQNYRKPFWRSYNFTHILPHHSPDFPISNLAPRCKTTQRVGCACCANRVVSCFSSFRCREMRDCSVTTAYLDEMLLLFFVNNKKNEWMGLCWRSRVCFVFLLWWISYWTIVLFLCLVLLLWCWQLKESRGWVQMERRFVIFWKNEKINYHLIRADVIC